MQVVAAGRDLTVVGLSCDKNVKLLMEQATSLGVDDLAIADESAAAKHVYEAATSHGRKSMRNDEYGQRS